MEEKKKKKTQVTKTEKKKENTGVKRQNNTSKKAKQKPTSKNNSKQSKKSTPKKEIKKNSSSKVTTTKKSSPKEVKQLPKKEVKTLPKEETQENLEKTIIFDGNQSKNILEVVDKLEEENIVLDDKVIKRSKTNKIIIFILVLLIAIVICATIGYLVSEYAKSEENNQTINSNVYKKVNSNYKNINEIEEDSKQSSIVTPTEYDNIEDITLADFEKKAYNKEDMTIFISSTTCYHSITFESIVDKVYGSLNKKIYRINITSLTDDEVKKFRTYYAFEGTPTIFTIKNGVVTAETTGTMTTEGLTKWVKENSV